MSRKPAYRTGNVAGYRGPPQEDPAVAIIYNAVNALIEEAGYEHVLAVLAMRRLAMHLEYGYRKTTAVPSPSVFAK